MRRKKRLIITVSARTPRSASNRSQSALSVMSDFSALSASRNSRCGSSLTRRYPPILLAAREPLLFEALHPLDGRGLVSPRSAPQPPAGSSLPEPPRRSPGQQVLRICTGHPRWPPPSQQVESEQCRFGNPSRFKLDAACSSARSRFRSLSCDIRRSRDRRSRSASAPRRWAPERRSRR